MRRKRGGGGFNECKLFVFIHVEFVYLYPKKSTSWTDLYSKVVILKKTSLVNLVASVCFHGNGIGRCPKTLQNMTVLFSGCIFSRSSPPAVSE